ncbi:MAG: glutamate 5-kinase [Abditibacteriales bacterium]|nr:glutamate 5-kinase [Abditibacteriales bacterium]MDW8367704.1 glutamate 5-kinase [Abditibacteriales bacterium]
MQNIVVKVGTSTLTQASGKLDTNYIAALVGQLTCLHKEGKRVVLVTSGAIRSGLTALGLTRARTVPEKQAAAAVGQSLLMHTYIELFRQHGIVAAQVLLTREDVADRQRFLNARNTFRQLFAFGALPIVNENDTVSVEEIRFGDNDMLAALVAIVTEADAVILLSDVEGFYLPGASQPLAVVSRITPDLMKAAGGAGSANSTGGMVTKLDAARVAMASGKPLIIAHGREPNVVLRLASGERLGTRFEPQPQSLTARQRWIAFGRKPKGALVVNPGAKEKLIAHGKSLLPVGIVKVEGNFEVGDLVSLVDTHGVEFARGLTNYSSADTMKIIGLRTSQIAKVLGHKDFDEVVHRDNLVIIA